MFPRLRQKYGFGEQVPDSTVLRHVRNLKFPEGVDDDTFAQGVAAFENESPGQGTRTTTSASPGTPAPGGFPARLSSILPQAMDIGARAANIPAPLGRFLGNMGVEQGKDILATGKVLAHGALPGVPAVNAAMYGLEHPEEGFRAAAASAGALAPMGVGAVGVKLGLSRMASGILSGGAGGFADAAIRSKGDPAAMAGGTTLGAILGGAGAKFLPHAPTTGDTGAVPFQMPEWSAGLEAEHPAGKIGGGMKPSLKGKMTKSGASALEGLYGKESRDIPAEPGELYHGTATPGLNPQTIDATATKAEGLFGQGVYMTDNPEVASGYAQARAKGGKPPIVYRAKLGDTPTLDMEKPASPEVIRAYENTSKSWPFEDQGGNYAEKFNAIKNQPGVTPEQLHRALSEDAGDLSREANVPASEFYDTFGGLNDELRNAGYEALTHTGGLRVGNVPHKVTILLDPQDAGGLGKKPSVLSFSNLGPVPGRPRAEVPASPKIPFQQQRALQGLYQAPPPKPPKPPVPTQELPESIFGKSGAIPSIIQQFTKVSELLRARGPQGAKVADLLEEQLMRGIKNVGGAEQALKVSGMFDLSRDEKLALGSARRTGNVAALSPKLKAVNDALTEYYGGAQERNIKAGTQLATPTGEKVPFPTDKRPNYLPKYFDADAASKKGMVRGDTIENMVKNEGFATPQEAERALDDAIGFVQGKRGMGKLAAKAVMDRNPGMTEATALEVLRKSKPRVGRAGSIEYTSKVPDSPFYDPDPVRATARYAHTTEPRLAQIEVLGQENQHANKLVADIQDPTVRDDVARLLNIGLGANERGMSGMEKLARGMRSLNVLKFSPWTTLQNSSQHLNTVLAGDVVPAAKGLRRAFTEEGERIARESGAVSGEAMHHYLSTAGGGEGGWVDAYLNAIGFSQAERTNRVVAANVGYEMAKKFAGKFLKDPTNARYAYELRALGLDPQAILRAGQATENDLLRGALKFSSNTQFRSSPLDLPPEATRTEIGRMMAQFKAFSYQQADLVLRETVDRAKAGQLGRVARNVGILGTLYPAVGAGLNAAKNYAQGNKQDTGFDQYTKGFQKTAGGGLPGDVAQSLDIGTKIHSAEPILTETAGPSIGGTAVAGQGLWNLIHGQKPKAYDKRRMIGAIPGVGSTVAPWFAPTPGKGTEGLPALLRRLGVPLPKK